MTYRCRTCKHMVRTEREKIDCCKNPIYQKLQTVHLAHEHGEGEVYANGALNSMQKLLKVPTAVDNPMRLCCKAHNTLETPATTHMLAVTCLDCIDYIKSIHSDANFAKE